MRVNIDKEYAQRLLRKIPAERCSMQDDGPGLDRLRRIVFQTNFNRSIRMSKKRNPRFYDNANICKVLFGLR